MKKRYMEIAMAVLLIAAACLFAVKGDLIVGSKNVKQKQARIVIDPGHGGCGKCKNGTKSLDD